NLPPNPNKSVKCFHLIIFIFGENKYRLLQYKKTLNNILTITGINESPTIANTNVLVTGNIEIRNTYINVNACEIVNFKTVKEDICFASKTASISLVIKLSNMPTNSI